MLYKSVILAFLVAAAPTLAFAQVDAERQRQERACRGDVTKLCRKVVDQGDMAIAQCLQSNEKKLSRSCRKMLEDNGQL